MPMLTCRVVSFIACSIAAHVLAQASSPWVALPIGGATPTATVSADGKLVLFRDTSVSVFSAVTNQWHSQTLSLGTSTVLKKDILLIPEHDRWTAFSAYRGVFAVQMVNNFTATIQHADSVAAVTEGTQLYVFSAFTGQWHSRTIPAGTTVRVDSRIVTVHAPAAVPPLLGAFDVHTGQWHDLPVLVAGSSLSIGGGAVTGFGGGLLFGFSPLRGAWKQMPDTSVFPQPYVQHQSFDGDLRGMRGSIFSAVTGTWTPSPLPYSATSPGTIEVNRSSALASGGGGYHALVGQDTWVPLPAGVAFWAVRQHIVAGYGNGQAYAVSAILGTTATTPCTAAGVGTSGSLAFANDPVTGGQSVYSAYTGQWGAMPAGAVGHPWLHDNSAVWLTGTGAVAVEARTGTFVPLAGAGFVRHNGYVVSSPSDLHVFDWRTGRWLSHPSQSGQNPVLSERIVIATDSMRAVGYGIRGGQLAEQPLSEPVIATVAADDVGYVRTATHVYAFSGLADTTTWQPDPDGDFGVGRGTRADLQARTPANHVVLLGFGPQAAAPLPLPWGELHLDLAGTVTLVLVPAAGESRAVVTLPIPTFAALRGTIWVQQALTLAPGGAIWLGTPSTLLVQ
ncbi:MAG TPA: hypothetical protein VF384_17575 [Planctomycetota bacterium]